MGKCVFPFVSLEKNIFLTFFSPFSFLSCVLTLCVGHMYCLSHTLDRSNDVCRFDVPFRGLEPSYFRRSAARKTLDFGLRY